MVTQTGPSREESAAIVEGQADEVYGRLLVTLRGLHPHASEAAIRLSVKVYALRVAEALKRRATE